MDVSGNGEVGGNDQVVAKEARFGIVGLGGMAHAHMEQLAKIPGARVTALCDTNAAAVGRAAAALGLGAERCHADYAALAADPAVDAVLSITPNNAHHGILKACLAAGKPFMTEKPFTRTYEEALELLELYRAAPVSGMVGFSYRYVPSFRYARELIRGGELGRVRSVFVQYLQAWGLPMFGTPMSWRYRSEVTGTGALGDLGSHMIDTARFMVGEFVEVAAHLNTFVTERPNAQTGAAEAVDVDDFAGFVALLEGGVSGVFQTSRNAYGSGNQLEVTVYGDLGTIKVGCETPRELVWIRPQAGADSPWTHVAETRKVPGRFEVGQMADFCDMLLSGTARDGLPALPDGYANQEVLEAIVLAAREKRTIALAERFPRGRAILADLQANAGDFP